MARSSEGKSLVVVESASKAKTINKYLGDDYVVKASIGHVRDLPKRGYGIDLTDNFKPTYEVSTDRIKVINELKKLAAKAPEIYLATDRDREGEAIAWHLVEALNLPADKVRRVIFNEITKTAIKEAFKHPHEIDIDRVNAQQARRILDRIVGYELSPLLWKKIAKGLSAGRVQSVVVRLIVEREREIQAFIPEETWKVFAYVCGNAASAEKLRGAWRAFAGGKDEKTQKDQLRWLSEHGALRAELDRVGGKPFNASHVDAARAVVEALGYKVESVDRKAWTEYPKLNLELVELHGGLSRPSGALRVSDLSTKRTTTRAAAPFTTATLQQQASTQLRFATSRTMRIAQGLYEGIDLHGEGPVGLITYMRTDSTNLAKEAIDGARSFVRQTYGEKYVPEAPNFFGKRQERAQEAHEAVRPTEPSRTPDSLRSALTDEQYKLYDLIWRRFIACQMPPAEWDSTSVKMSCDTSIGAAEFSANGRKLVFDGFMKVAGVSSDDPILPGLTQGQEVGLIDLEPKQTFSSPPPRYTEASLVKAMETEGIGRPSTYASVTETIQDRGYVEQVDRKFYPTALGEVVTDRLVAAFPNILDVKFTSHMENELDKIEESHLDWVSVLHEFYDPFKELLDKADAGMDAARNQPSEHKCPQCDSPMLYRWSKTGRFLSCSTYPTCNGTLNVDRDGNPLVPKATDFACEQCGKPMVVRRARTGIFLGCSGYPDCRGTHPCDEQGQPLTLVPEEEVTQPCPACNEGTMRVRWKLRKGFLGCDKYPQCKNTGPLPAGIAVKRKPAPPPEDAGAPCDKCNRPMVIRTGKRGPFLSCSGFPKCRNAKPVEKLDELKALAADKVARGESIAPPPETGGAKRGRAARTAGEPASKMTFNPADPPPPGFAWTRTGKPVVELMPEDGTLPCPECGGTMELRRGRFGPFFSCTGFPRCKFVANLRGEAKKAADEIMPAPARPKPIDTVIPCDQCGGMMVIRHSQRGRFLGCKAYPKCKGTKPLPEELAVTAGAIEPTAVP